MREQILGVSLLMLIGLAIGFTHPIDILFFTACMYCFGFVMAEVGIWVGVLYRKEDEP